MRAWFIIGCKLLGIYFFYRGLEAILGSIAFIGAFASSAPDTSDPFETFMFVNTILFMLLMFSFSLILMFRTTWLASILKLSDETSLPMPKGKSSLRIGVILIGLYVFITRIGSLARVIYKQFMVDNTSQDVFATYPSSLRFTEDTIAPIISVVSALILIFSSNFIVKIIYRTRNTDA